MNVIPTAIVAAHDATSDDKLAADVICDGIHDSMGIQFAIELLEEQGGGVLFLTSGYFDLRPSKDDDDAV